VGEKKRERKKVEGNEQGGSKGKREMLGYPPASHHAYVALLFLFSKFFSVLRFTHFYSFFIFLFFFLSFEF
jgi:hypothetical protein